jgi:hypothetical protein
MMVRVTGTALYVSVAVTVKHTLLPLRCPTLGLLYDTSAGKVEFVQPALCGCDTP